MKKMLENAAFLMGIGGVLAACLYMFWVMAVTLLIKMGWLNIQPPNQDLMEVPFFLAATGISLCGLLLTFILASENPLKGKRRS